MGFNDAMSGFKKLKNDKGYSNEDLLTLLKNVQFAFGTPQLGTLTKKETILFEPNIGRLVVYLRANEKSIEMGSVAAPGNTGKFVLKELGASILTDAQSEDAAKAQRAVDELYEVVKGLVETGVVENKSVQDDGIELYMQQKVLTIKDKYSICTLEEEPVYWVEGNLLGLKYQIEDAQGQQIYEIRKKMIAVLPEYTIMKDGKKVAELKKKIRLTRPEILGKVEGKELQIKGDLTGYHFSIAIDGKVVGNVDTKRLTWGDVYAIGIRDVQHQELVVTIAIIVDNILKSKN